MPQPTDPTLTMSSKRIAYIEAGWHGDIVRQARQTCLQAFDESGVSADQVELVPVPGSLEIPLAAQRLARSGRFDVILAAGLITDGGIYRHDFVARAVIDGMMRVQLDEGISILSAVLTPHHFHDHGEHEAFFRNHFLVKGKELAEACLQILTFNQRLVAGWPSEFASKMEVAGKD